MDVTWSHSRWIAQRAGGIAVTMLEMGGAMRCVFVWLNRSSTLDAPERWVLRCAKVSQAESFADFNFDSIEEANYCARHFKGLRMDKREFRNLTFDMRGDRNYGPAKRKIDKRALPGHDFGRPLDGRVRRLRVAWPACSSWLYQACTEHTPPEPPRALTNG